MKRSHRVGSQPKAETLSEHLLGEINTYLVYPDKLPRGVRPPPGRYGIDKYFSDMVEGRRTFTPKGYEYPGTPEGQMRVWNHVYCHELLLQVRGMVERTQALEPLVLDYDQDNPPPWMVHLREAAKCLLVWLPTATMALARAAIEAPLRERYAMVTNEKIAYSSETPLLQVINGLHMFKKLTDAQRDWADEIRRVTGKELHDARKKSSLKKAMHVYASARSLLFSLHTTPGRREKAL